MTHFLFASSLFLFIILRVVVRLILPKRRGTDTYYHLLIAEAIRENGFRAPLRFGAFTLEKKFRYPWHFHGWLSLLPKESRERMEPFVGLFVDALHLGMIITFTDWMANHPNLASISLKPFEIVTWTSLLFAVYPGLLVFGVGPRMHELTPRPFGQFLFSVLIFSSIAFIQTGNYFLMSTSIIAGALMLLSSKFSAQVLIFTFPLLSIISGSWFLVLLPILSLVVALLLSRGRYLDILYGQVMHLTYYRKRLNHPALRKRNDLSVVLKIPKLLVSDPGKIYHYLAIGNSWMIALVRNPMLWFLIFLVLGKQEYLFKEPLSLIVWLPIVLILPFIFTSLKPFLFLGEAERYLEYGAPMVCVVLPIMLSNYNDLWGGLSFVLLFLFCLGFVLADYWMTIRNHKKYAHNRIELQEELIEWLKSLSTTALIMLVPGSWMRSRIPYETHHLLLDFGTDWGMHRLTEMEQLWSEYYPYPTDNIRKIITKYSVDLIIAKKPLNPPDESGLDYDFSPYWVVFSNDRYNVYSATEKFDQFAHRNTGVQS